MLRVIPKWAVDLEKRIYKTLYESAKEQNIEDYFVRDSRAIRSAVNSIRSAMENIKSKTKPKWSKRELETFRILEESEKGGKNVS
jgi:hypothetical protein